MKKILFAFAILALLFSAVSCSYDDKLVKDEIDKLDAELSSYESRLEKMKADLKSAAELVVSGQFIVSMHEDEYGNYVIEYYDSEKKLKTVTIATKSDILSGPFLGVYEDPGTSKWYWHQTSDNGATWEDLKDGEGNRIEVCASDTEVDIDNDGYWTVDGVSTGMLANDVSNVLFQSVSQDPSTGEVTFVLADGSSCTISAYEDLTLNMDCQTVVPIANEETSVEIYYSVQGSLASETVVDCAFSYGVSVSMNLNKKCAVVKFIDGYKEGTAVFMASNGPQTALKPVYFSLGTVVINQPTWDPQYGTGTEMYIPGQETSFDFSVQHNVEYEVKISDDAKDWLTEVKTKGDIVTSVHHFTASEYHNELGVERKGTISLYNKTYNVTVDVLVHQSPVKEKKTENGIESVADFMDFVRCVNAGTSYDEYMKDGEVVLLKDLDLTGITEWTPIGTTESSQSTSLVLESKVSFTGVFNGNGHSITGIDWTVDASTTPCFGLFGNLSGATLKNLVVGGENDKIKVTGKPSVTVLISPVVCYAYNSKIQGVTNNVSVEYAAEIPQAMPACLAGVLAAGKHLTLGGSLNSQKVYNYGSIKVSYQIENTGAGAGGAQLAGICAYVLIADSGKSSTINKCTNCGDIACPTGRSGGIVATVQSSTAVNKNVNNCVISNCVNEGTLMDDYLGFGYVAASKRTGGLIGGSAATGLSIEACTNKGNVFSQQGSRSGGFAGHISYSSGYDVPKITGCENTGIILSDYESGNGGPGWAAGFCGSTSIITGCRMGGRVGDWSVYKDNPSGAPTATDDTALGYRNGKYDPSKNN